MAQSEVGMVTNNPTNKQITPTILNNPIKNKNPIFFDEKMTWLLDCDYYKRLYEKYGEPTIINDVNVVIGVGSHQTTSSLSKQIKDSEEEYMLKKHT